MLPLLGVFVLWLALTGRLAVYGELMKTGPGWGGLTGMASRAVGGTGTPNATNTVTGRAATPPGQGPLDWFWNKIFGGGAPSSNPGSGAAN